MSRVPMPINYGAMPGGYYNAAQLNNAQLKQAQATAQNANALQQSKINSAYMSPEASVLANPIATRAMNPQQIQSLTNSLLQRTQNQNSSQGSNNNSILGSIVNHFMNNNQPNQPNNSLNQPPTNNNVPPTSDTAPTSSQISGHALAGAAGFTNPKLVSSSQQNVANANNLSAQFGDPNTQGTPANTISQLSALGNFWNMHAPSSWNATTIAGLQTQKVINQLNSQYGHLYQFPPLGNGQSGSDYVANAQKAIYELQHGNYNKQQLDNIMAGNQGTVSTPVYSPNAPQKTQQPLFSNLSQQEQDTINKIGFNDQEKNFLNGGVSIQKNGTWYKIVNGQISIKRPKGK